MIEDPANCVLNTVASAMRLVMAPTSEQPPLGGGTDRVLFFAGEALPIEAFNFYRADSECAEPFVWVRLIRRYRSKNFPAPYNGGDPCPVPVVVPIEVGIARCAAVDMGDCDGACYESEAEISLDDSWRIERALCFAASKLRQTRCALQVGLDDIVPYGPSGGVVAWTGVLYAQLGGEE